MSAPTQSAPTAEQAASRQLASLLVYAMQMMGQSVSDWIEDAARCPTGDENQTPVMESILTDLIVSMDERTKRFVVYNGRNPNARALAGWWHTLDMARRAQTADQTDPSDIVHMRSDHA